MTKYPNGSIVLLKEGKLVVVKCQSGDAYYDKLRFARAADGFLDTTDYMAGRGWWYNWSSVKEVVETPIAYSIY